MASLNPARAVGLDRERGSIERGKVADLVLWEPAMFGAKPKMVIKGGMIAWANMGDPNASLPTPQPMIYRPMFGAYGGALGRCCLTFVSKAAAQRCIGERLGLRRRVVAVEGTRTLTKQHMVLNGATPNIEVNAENFQVSIDGKPVTLSPAQSLPLAQLYFFS